MGFMDKMKAANGFNLGHIESPDFPCGILIIKQGKLTIIRASINGDDYERVVEQSDIKVFKLIGCGGTWAKYYIEFNDGKSGIITQDVVTEAQKQKNGGSSMASIERYIKVVDNSMSTVSSSSVTKEEPKPVCPNCGAPIEGDMRFCEECGTKLK